GIRDGHVTGVQTCALPISTMIASKVSDELRAPAPLDYTPEVARATASIFERVRRVIPEIEWPVHAPYIAAINALKRERNAIILRSEERRVGKECRARWGEE